MKAALFDLDGVVFDTEPQYSIFWGQIGREYHPEIPDFENKIKGQTLVQIYARYFDTLLEEQAQITERLNEFERNMRFEFIDGFEDYIKSLRARGVKTAVVTSSNQAKMEAVYAQHEDFRRLFDKILTSEDFSESKPSPDCYIKGAQYFGVEPADCVVFEDSFNGLKSGRASGAYVVGLATTNSAQSITPYCDKVIENYQNCIF